MTQLLELSPSESLDLSAASGVVALGDMLLVIADDEVALGLFDTQGVRIGEVPLELDALPLDPVLRKTKKPDFESLVDLGDGFVAALGSGSTTARHKGKLVEIMTASVQDIDLASLHGALGAKLSELNIEGAVFHGDRCLLAQRGNGALRLGALVVLDAALARTSLLDGTLPGAALREIVEVDLGTLDGVPLSFTDLAIDPAGRLWFAAAAEDTLSTYDDGACCGSVIGLLDDTYRVVVKHVVSETEKVEGICFDLRSPDALRGWLVTDADDPGRRASLTAFAIHEA